ncbi:MAG: flippase-like domain-containing protein [Candidatus Omnitrophica bacterium]|nr:flippase-like domain-containing protein [Candidatus Omnitrophota bacterium]
MERFKKILGIVFRIAISIALLAFLLTQVDKESLFEVLRNANKPFLFLAFFILFFNYALCLFRWEMLLKTLNIHLPLKRVIMSFAGGHFFNLFLPSTIGGDLMRSIDLTLHTKKPKEVIATIFLDRLSGYIGLVFLALMSLSVGWRLVRNPMILFCVAGITGVLIIILLVIFNKKMYRIINQLLHSPKAGKIRELIKNLHQEIHFFQHHEKAVVTSLIFSIFIQAVIPLVYYVIALSLGLRLNIIYFFVFFPIIGVITLLPISIGGLGLRDAATIFFFGTVGVSRDLAFAMSLVAVVFIMTYGAIGGLIYVLTIRHRRLQRHKTPSAHPHK